MAKTFVLFALLVLGLSHAWALPTNNATINLNNAPAEQEEMTEISADSMATLEYGEEEEMCDDCEIDYDQVEDKGQEDFVQVLEEVVENKGQTTSKGSGRNLTTKATIFISIVGVFAFLILALICYTFVKLCC